MKKLIGMLAIASLGVGAAAIATNKAPAEDAKAIKLSTEIFRTYGGTDDYSLYDDVIATSDGGFLAMGDNRSATGD